MVGGVAAMFREHADMAFRALTVRSLEGVAGHADEVVAYVRGLVGNRRLNYRFWLCRGPTGWKIYDFEDADGGPRCTQAAAAAVAAGASTLSAPGWSASAQRFTTINAALSHGDYDVAAREVLQLDGAGFPAQYEALRLVTRGMVSAHVGNPQAALVFYDKAEGVRSDLPGLHLLRAACFNVLGEPEKALASAKRHLDLFGEDARAYFEIGRAYERLGYPEVAEAAYQRGLNDDPGSRDNMRALDRLREPPMPPPATEATTGPATVLATLPTTAPATGAASTVPSAAPATRGLILPK
jgi:hypothetical protein